MIRIRALNEPKGESDEEDEDGPRKATKEIQEEEGLSNYTTALTLLTESKAKEAAQSLEEILQSPYLNLNGEDNRTFSPIQRQLRMGCLKTLSEIYASMHINYEGAVRVLNEATKLESYNVSLWYRLGLVEIKLVNYQSALKAFQEGFHVSPGHWGCIENLVSLTYALHDNVSCLKFCGVGLKKDRGFIKGLVFRDHIYHLDPAMKESIKCRISNVESLNVEGTYEDSWKLMYLNEVRELMRLESEKNESILEEEFKERQRVMICPIPLKDFTFVELCSVVIKFHATVKCYGTFLRPIRLPGESTSLMVSNISSQRKDSVTEDELDVCEEISRASTVRRSSSDDKDSTSLVIETKVDLPEGTRTVDNTSDASMEGCKRLNAAQEVKQESEGGKEETDIPKRKSKKGLKWWQLEGKRRSQRVKCHLMPSSHKTSKENKFVDKLRTIIPATLLSEVTTETEQTIERKSPEKNKVPLNPTIDSYFGTEKEASEVKAFVVEYGTTNIMTVVIRLTELLSRKTEIEWPTTLALEYKTLYQLYRSHVMRPNLFLEDENDLDLEDLRSDSMIILTMLELLLDNTVHSSVRELSQGEQFLPEIYPIKQAVYVLGDRTLNLRLNWLLAKYYLLLSNVNDINLGFEDAHFYLNCVERELCSHSKAVRISTRVDNVICLDEVKKKVNFINRMENVNKIHELYNAKQFEDLIDVLNYSLTPEDSTSTDFTNRLYLAESYFRVENYSDCLEQCLKIIKCASNGKISDKGILTKALALLENICIVKYKDNSYALSMKYRKSVVQSLFTLFVYIEKVINDTSAINKDLTMPKVSATSWCVLHNILYQLEFHESALYLDDEAVPNSILLLQFAHECVSASNNDCLLDNGKLLLYIVEELVHLKSIQGIHLEYEETKHCIEQSIFCLYGHPSRKSKVRHLNDHNTGSGVPLEWDKCSNLYDYYKPNDIPEFDSYDSINADVEGLFQRILAAMPDEVKPSETFQNIKDYLEGKIDKVNFNTKGKEFPPRYIDIFYLVGDHHFKAKEWTKSVDYYSWDLAVTNTRFDSWAGIALAKGGMIICRLNSCENFAIDEIILSANTVSNCFRRALTLEPGNTKIKIEFGSFVYAMHSFCSRLLKQNADLLSMEKFEMIESKKDEFLAAAAKSFESMATKVNHCDEGHLASSQEEERWIHHYMLGKVFEKLDSHDPDKFLAQYELAGERLHQQGATYPSKISFYNPPELAVEALEIYYRIHASILNFLEKHDYNPEIDKILTTRLLTAASSPFIKLKAIRGSETADTRRKKELQDTTDISLTMEYILDGVEAKLRDDEALEKQKSPDDSPGSTNPTSFEDITSESSMEVDFFSYPPPDPVRSYGLSAFKAKMREKDVRSSKEESTSEKSNSTEMPTKGQQNSAELQTKISEPVGRLVVMSAHFKEHKYGHIISQCVNALEECISRFPAHHKSFYRLSHTHSVFGNAKISNKICKEWLLGCGPLDKKKICGLFSDRKPNNFFNCVWRNPVDDIDRPGSFPYHMSKTISHLLTVLENLNDHEMLVEIAIQLSKVPDTDKQYLYNFEREQYSQQAFISCVAAAKRFVHENKNRIHDAGSSIFASYVKLQKFNPKENVMAGVLLDTYKVHLALDNANVTIEQAFKFYQHLAWTTKMQNTIKSSTASKFIAGTTANGSQEAGSTTKNDFGNGVSSINGLSKTKSAARVAWNQQKVSTAVVYNQSDTPAVSSSCHPNTTPNSSLKHTERKSEESYSKSGSIIFSAGADVRPMAKKLSSKAGNSMRGTLPTDLSKKSGTFADATARKLENKPEILTSRSNYMAMSQTPWVPYFAENSSYYSTPPSSLTTSTTTTSAHGLPKIFPNPSFAELSVRADLNSRTIQYSTIPGSSSELNVSRQKDAKAKRKFNAQNLRDPKRICPSLTVNSLKKRPRTKEDFRRDISQTHCSQQPVGLSIPPISCKIPCMNTSPFRAQSTKLFEPEWSIRQLERNHDYQSNPPAAHSQSVNFSGLARPIYVDITSSPPDVIDLTKKTPEKATNPLDIDSPEKEVRKPMERGSPEITLVNLDAVLGKSTSSYPLPPKKKHIKELQTEITRDKY